MGTGPPAQVRLRPLMFALTSRRCKKRTLRPLLQVAQARLQVPSGRPCLLYHSRRKVGCPRHIKVRIPTDESNAGTRAAGVFVNVGGIDIYPLQPRRRSPNALMTLATILGTGASVLVLVSANAAVGHRRTSHRKSPALPPPVPLAIGDTKVLNA